MARTTVEISPAGQDWIAETAQRRHVEVDTVVRALFTIGTRHPDEVDAYLTEQKP